MTTTKIKLYHCSDARSLRPLWALEEMGLEYELINMEFPPRATYPGYLDLNPLGTVPTLTDGELVMTESSGICHYLEDMYGSGALGVAKDHPAYGE
ncbi:MAG: glutathione S-transferase N-terminal domain-containing protein, partial [Pseudomonadota bacterium]|nr:glutathione S-transferase N-terminal domain-containing protein [Pseudomonadota bacterium]